MKVLLIGSGGREHALAWKLAQSPTLTKLSAAPGNPGIGEHAELVPLDIENHDAVLAFCRENMIGLVVVGPEAPLVTGLADRLRDGGIATFGPSAAAARTRSAEGDFEGGWRSSSTLETVEMLTPATRATSRIVTVREPACSVMPVLVHGSDDTKALGRTGPEAGPSGGVP